MNVAIILSGGTGSRVGTDVPKQFLKIASKPVLAYSIETFEMHHKIDEIIIVSHPDYVEQTSDIVKNNGFNKVSGIFPGGKTRQDSSWIGISSVTDAEKVLIHDGARPFISGPLIDRLLDGLENYKAVVPAIPSADTLIETDVNSFIKRVPDRKRVQRVQTPQAFDFKMIKKAHSLAQNDNISDATDDCSLILRYKLSEIYVIEGSIDNIKITYPSDLANAEHIFKNSI